MLSLLLGRGLGVGGMVAGPLAICAALLACAAMCKCMSCCTKCKLRDCSLIKRFLLMTGQDPFDDFELMVLVHEAMFESKESKLTTVVRLTAGSHTVKTDPNSNNVFQQPLHITVEQGTEHVVVDLLDSHSRLLATMSFHVKEHIISLHSSEPEMIHNMKPKGKGIRNPKIKLTMVVASLDQDEDDFGLTSGVGLNSEVDLLVRQQLKKAKQADSTHVESQHSEIEVLKQACSGPLELFEGLGKTISVYVAALGPPSSRRWVLGVWKDIKDFELKKQSIMEIDLLRVQSVQADPARHHVFVIHCFDESRVRKSLTFRRTDRARDVWVEILHLLVVKARELGKGKKTQAASASSTGGDPRSSSSGSRNKTSRF